MIGERVKLSFVARIWLENGNNGDAKWRGHVRHVQGEEEAYFQDLVEMREFMGRVSAVTESASIAEPFGEVTKSDSNAIAKCNGKV